MTDISTDTPTGGQAAAAGGFRRGSLTALRAVGGITMLAIVVQFVLAGLGAFDASFDPHRMLGSIIGLLTVVLLVLTLLARPGWMTVGLAVLLMLLALVLQPVLAALGDDTDAWFGGIHALNGLAIMGLTARVAFNSPGFDSTRSRSRR